VRFCIVGYGSIGRRHHSVLSSIFSNSSFDIVDLNTELKIEDCIHSEYDVLIITTPTSSHLDVLSRFSKINRLIFIEKPLDISSKKIKKFMGDVDHRKVHVGCNLRFTNAYRDLQDISHRVKIANIISMSYLPDWRKGDHREKYSSIISQGGGALLDFIHEPDYAFSLFGMPNSCHVLEKRLFDITVDSNDTCSMVWEYNDKIINFLLSYGSKKYTRSCQVISDDSELTSINFSLEDINKSYENQWRHILKNGPVNTYEDCLRLYHKIGL